MLAQYDKAAVAKRFTRNALAYAQHAEVQQASARYLLGLLQAWAREERVVAAQGDHLSPDLSHRLAYAANQSEAQLPFTNLIDLGCGPGVNSFPLAALTQHYIGVDIAAGMLTAAQQQCARSPEFSAPSNSCSKMGTVAFMQADMEQLPFANNAIAAIYSNLAVQWSNQPLQLLNELHRVLKPGGVAFISTVLNDSLQPFADLRRCYLQRAGVNPQPTLLQWQAWLQQAGFSVNFIEECKETAWFADLKALVRSISRIGADQQSQHAAPQLASREWLSHLQNYETYRTENGLPLHYQVGYFCITK